MILQTAPQLYDNINLFGLDGLLGGRGVSSASWKNKCTDQGDKNATHQ
jgi:hypothetical protein